MADITRTRCSLSIVNQRGLHARASAAFARLASGFESQITVAKDGETVLAGSIMGLMMLGAAKGDSITLTATGSDAEAALEALGALVGNGFGEED